MTTSLWIVRPSANITLDELTKAIPATLADPRVDLTHDRLRDAAHADLTVAALPVTLHLHDALTVDDFGGDQAQLEADPRQHRYASLTTTPSGAPNLRYLGILLAEALGASLYDPHADDPWLSVGDHTLEELGERLDG